MILFSSILFCFLGLAEEEPPAEYPYPQRQLAVDELGVEKPVRKGKRGEYYYDTKKKGQKKSPYQGVQKPYKIGSDGSYYYNDEAKQIPEPEGYEGVEQPIDRDSRGGYYYSRKKKKRKSQVKYGPKPSKINADGSYMYNVDAGETENTMYLRGGISSSPDISSKNGGTYNDVYGDKDNFLLTFEYDWQLTSSLYLKAGTGFTSTQGKGQFASGNNSREPKETFQFFVFPNTLSLSYKFQLWNIQMVTPYIEGGPGYFTFIENRSDGDFFSFNGETTKYGGAFVATATAGLLISMSRWTSGTALITDYGATQSWIDLQFRQVFGLDKRKDFTSNMITGGIAIGF